MTENTNFTLPDSDGAEFKASEHLPLVLYFYPKDSTSGCTTEAREFTELAGEFRKLGYTVAGVSRDSQKSHQNFICRYGLGITLLSDPEEKVCRQFDVIHEKNMYGRKVQGVVRSTFVIGKDGKIVFEWRKVKAAGHAAQVLEAVKGA
ncbi:peroxiredoxin [Mesosutterella sp. OilRF-GAM-744-9]|uniref:thioredoxin-dependent peroxiredoxin n=1 Tax=Mesosutterella porci TaxID=2915351 RepID=A0ABS9MMZ2_9BURK|nr:peroxiredoxin [Mesosutterella sp. oilRF-744-WT-GAM-9]MCG5029982.1 peroxiredoxin [Mesosutterella sp. oilRF-744-WT-GAM-9]